MTESKHAVAGIVCEFNPFHKGHEYLLQAIRDRKGTDTVIIGVMSGDFVQRGEPAGLSKYARAEAACACGADLIIELLPQWSLASAERFAAAGISLLIDLGIDTLAFGSEYEDAAGLKAAAAAILQPEFRDAAATEQKAHPELSYASARQIIMSRMHPELEPLLATPNSLLGVEYCKALLKRESNADLLVIRRVGAGHDADITDDTNLLSGTAIRRELASGRDISAFVPSAMAEILNREIRDGREPVTSHSLEPAILSRLRLLKEQDFDLLPDAADGTGRRLARAVRETADLDSLIAAARTKRTTEARIRRMILCAALGIRGVHTVQKPTAARLLAATGRGREYLRENRDGLTIPVITKPAHIEFMEESVRDSFVLASNAHDFYVLAYGKGTDRTCGQDMKAHPVILP